MKAFTIPSVFKAVDQMTQPIRGIVRSIKSLSQTTQEELARMERRFRSLSSAAADVSKKAAIIGLAVLAPLILATREAIAFEDRMADIAKTTGLSGASLEKYGNALLSMSGDTRTSIEELQTIGAIGGQLGIAEKDLVGFTDSVNKFNVALGSDFSGGVDGATRAISGLKTLFKETRNLEISDAITRAGSAINALSAKGVVVPELTEFISRVGQLPDAIKPSIQDVAAFGSVFNKAGITAEIASRAFGDVLLTGSQNLSKFAKQMGLTNQQAAALINTNPSKFVTEFAKSLKGMDAVGLSKTLKALKLTDAGAIKVVGALGSSLDMLAEFQGISNREFQAGTSLLNEYNAKNNTTAANLAKAQNNLKVFAITAGTLLLPVLNDLIKMIVPVLRSFTAFARNNPKTTKTILILAAAIGILSLAVSGIAFGVKLWADVMLIWAARAKLVTAAQWAWNAAMSANPIGLTVIAVAALIVVVVAMVKHWNEWGAALSLVLGPLGFVVSLIQSFRENWDFIAKSFSTGGIVSGIMAIGKTIFNAIIYPLQQVLQIMASFTGSEKLAQIAKGIEQMRVDMGLQVTPAVNPKATEQEAMTNRIDSITNKQNATITVKDETGRAEVDSGKGPIPISLSSTLQF